MSTTNYFPLNVYNSKETDTTVDNFKNQCTNKAYIFNGSNNVDKSICDSINADSSSSNVSSVAIKKQTIIKAPCLGECVTNPSEVPEDYYGNGFATSEYDFDYCGSDDNSENSSINYYYAKNPINCDDCSYPNVKTTICDADSDLSCTAADPMTDYKLDIYAAAKSYINFSKDIEIIKDEAKLNDNIIGINLRWDQSLEFNKCDDTGNDDTGNCGVITESEVVHFYLTTKAISSIKIYAATIDANTTFINLNSKAICATGNPGNLISVLDTKIDELPSEITSTETLKNKIATKLGSNNASSFSSFVLCKVTYENSTFILPFIWRKKNDNSDEISYPRNNKDKDKDNTTNEFPLSVFNITDSTTNPFTGNVFKSGERGYYLNINYPLTKIYKPILTKDPNTGKTKCTIPIRAPFSESIRYHLEKVSEDDYIEDDNVEDDYVEDDYIEDDNTEDNISTTKSALIRYKDCCSGKGGWAHCIGYGTDFCTVDETPATAISILYDISIVFGDYRYNIKPYCTLNEATYDLKLNQFTLDYSNENCANFDICTFNSFKSLPET